MPIYNPARPPRQGPALGASEASYQFLDEGPAEQPNPQEEEAAEPEAAAEASVPEQQEEAGPEEPEDAGPEESEPRPAATEASYNMLPPGPDPEPVEEQEEDRQLAPEEIPLPDSEGPGILKNNHVYIHVKMNRYNIYDKIMR